MSTKPTPLLDAFRRNIADKTMADLTDEELVKTTFAWMEANQGYGITAAAEKGLAHVDVLVAGYERQIDSLKTQLAEAKEPRET